MMEYGNDILDNVDYASQPHSHVQLRDNSQRAKVALILIGVVGGLSIFGLISNIMQYNLLQAAKQGLVSMEEANANDLRQQLIAWTTIVAYIVSIIFFICWFRRAYFNLQLAGISTRFTEGWAAGAWFVPFLNLVRPVRIMTEIWEGNDELTHRVSSDRYYLLTGGKALIGIWWATHIIGGIIARVEFQMARNAMTIYEIEDLTVLSCFSGFLSIISGLILFILVRKVSAMEKEVYKNQHLIAAVA